MACISPEGVPTLAIHDSSMPRTAGRKVPPAALVVLAVSIEPMGLRGGYGTEKRAHRDAPEGV